MKPLFATPFLCFSLMAANSSVDSLTREGQWEAAQWPSFQTMLNRPAPKLDLHRWAIGEATPRQMKGKIIVVDFWATWCAPCIQAIPHNNQLLAKYRHRGVLIIGACTGGHEETMETIARGAGAMYPTAIASKATATEWKIKYFPTYAIIDRKGVLRAIGIQPGYLDKILDALLAEQPD